MTTSESEPERDSRTEAAAEPNPSAVRFADFLSSTPPGASVNVADLGRRSEYNTTILNVAPIVLHCDDPSCEGPRFFDAPTIRVELRQTWNSLLVYYSCRNCTRTRKTFAIMYCGSGGFAGKAYKLGEYPQFGPPNSPRVSKLLGDDRELFQKGRRSEIQGLGIGAFAYYRRVVDQQWQRILGEIIKVATRVGTPEKTIAILRAAALETQFGRAVDAVKHAIPDSLQIEGHNPITLLYKALSEGLHEKSDGQCLEMAGAIRAVLTELAERISQALADDRELKDAIARLHRRGSSAVSAQESGDQEL